MAPSVGLYWTIQQNHQMGISRGNDTYKKMRNTSKTIKKASYWQSHPTNSYSHNRKTSKANTKNKDYQVISNEHNNATQWNVITEKRIKTCHEENNKAALDMLFRKQQSQWGIRNGDEPIFIFGYVHDICIYRMYCDNGNST